MIIHIIKITIGIILVLIGLIGGLVPIFQGWVFGLPGLVLLAEYFPPAQKVLKWAKIKIGKRKP